MEIPKFALFITVFAVGILWAQEDSSTNNDSIMTINIDTSSTSPSAIAIKDYIKKTWGLDKCKDFSDINCMKPLGWEYKKKSLKYVKRKFKNATSEMFIKERDDFYSKYKDGDIIYFYNSPKITWEKLMGRQGYMIIRNDTLVSIITTLLN
jgi:hypothetical protein